MCSNTGEDIIMRKVRAQLRKLYLRSNRGTCYVEASVKDTSMNDDLFFVITNFIENCIESNSS
jgi:hypothetical protein